MNKIKILLFLLLAYSVVVSTITVTQLDRITNLEERLEVDDLVFADLSRSVFDRDSVISIQSDYISFLLLRNDTIKKNQEFFPIILDALKKEMALSTVYAGKHNLPDPYSENNADTNNEDK